MRPPALKKGQFNRRDAETRRKFLSLNFLSSPRLSLCLCVSAVAFLFSTVAKADAPTTAPSVNTKAVIIQIQGEINDYTRDQLEQRIDQVRGMGGGTVILSIDTYGGILTDGLDMSRFIKRQSDLHIVAYVKDKAISAGAMIAMACDEIVMSDSASLGDCAPSSSAPKASRPCPKPSAPRRRRLSCSTSQKARREIIMIRYSLPPWSP